MKKSVAIVVCAWPPSGGGIGNNAYYLAQKLIERGRRVGVFTLAFPGIDQAKRGYDFFPLKSLCHWGKAGFMIGLTAELKKYDVIHLFYPFFGSDLLVWYVKSRRPQVKLVLHYEMDALGEGALKLVFALYRRLFLGALIKAADTVAVLSFDHAGNSYLAPYLKRWPQKFAELPNGIDGAIFFPREKNHALGQANKISVQDKVIIFVGGLDSQHYFKGVPVLLKAVADLPLCYFPNVLDGEAKRGTVGEMKGETKLLIIGDGNLRPEFERQAKDLGIANRVIFTGWIKNEMLPEYYSLADIFVLPSTASTESFGIVVAEAQACGLPAVVANWPGVRATLIDGETGLLVQPNDEKDLADKLKTLLTDEQLCRRFGEQGRANATGKYEWSKVADAAERIYDN